MNWDVVEGSWKEMKGKVRERWGRLTNDEIETIAGRRDQLAGTIQRVYGKTKEEVSREIDDFCSSCTKREDPLDRD